MKNPILIMFAAFAASTAVEAQIVAPPVRWEDVPVARMNINAVSQVHHASGASQTSHHIVHFPRVGPGFIVPPFWFGPQFHVQNWQIYRFPAPFEGGRWIRYYDDALLIDSYGRVHDIRTGLDWDEYGERWSYDRGIPEYVGKGDYRPREEDYAAIERLDRGERYHYRPHAYSTCPGGIGYAYGYAPGAPPPPPPPPDHCGYTHPGWYGYYYGYAWGPVVVTETTVTTIGSVVTKTYVKKAKPQRHYIRKSPPAGERG